MRLRLERDPALTAHSCIRLRINAQLAAGITAGAGAAVRHDRPGAALAARLHRRARGGVDLERLGGGSVSCAGSGSCARCRASPGNGNRKIAGEMFAAEMTAGQVPSLRAIQSRMRIGQARAQDVQAFIRGRITVAVPATAGTAPQAGSPRQGISHDERGG